jgi:hypothetical protein
MPVSTSNNLTVSNRECFNEEKYSDLIIRTEDVKIAVHKVILALRSPVFASMFSSGMQESTQSEITLHEAYPQVLKDFVEYLYTDSVRLQPGLFF